MQFCTLICILLKYILNPFHHIPESSETSLPPSYCIHSFGRSDPSVQDGAPSRAIAWLSCRTEKLLNSMVYGSVGYNWLNYIRYKW